MRRRGASLGCAAAVIAGALTVSACGDESGDAVVTVAPAESSGETTGEEASQPTAEPAGAPSTTSAASPSTTLPAATAPAATAAPGPTSTAPTTTVLPTPPVTTAVTGDDGVTAVAGNPDLDEWHLTPSDHRADIGRSFRYECPPGGAPETIPIWGVGTYTDDSSVCVAAVHAGLITAADGGSVMVTISTGQDSYRSGVANGITSSSYGVWPGSFFFPAAPPETIEAAASTESWAFSVVTLGIAPGTTGTLFCAPGGPFGTVWGTGVYTGDSSICTAAVHFGVIAADTGGSVAFDVLGEQPEFVGSSARGVTTLDYGSYGPSFQFSD